MQDLNRQKGRRRICSVLGARVVRLVVSMKPTEASRWLQTSSATPGLLLQVWVLDMLCSVFCCFLGFSSQPMHREGDCWLSDKMAQAYKELWAGRFVSCKKSSMCKMLSFGSDCRSWEPDMNDVRTFKALAWDLPSCCAPHFTSGLKLRCKCKIICPSCSRVHMQRSHMCMSLYLHTSIAKAQSG